MYSNIKVIAMDLDGTLTQHKTPLSKSIVRSLPNSPKTISS